MSFERFAIFVEANAEKAIAEFKKVGAEAKKAGTDAETGGKGLGRFGIAGQTAGNLIKKGVASIGVAAAGAAIIKFASDGVDAFMEVTGEIRNFQRITGAAAEDASKFIAVFHALGIEPEAASNAIFKLSSRIGANNKQLADSGVIIARNKSGTVDLIGTILNVGDAYKATADASKRANIVTSAFGAKQGLALLPLLGKTRAEIEAIIKTAAGRDLIFNQAQLDKAKEFSIATRELGESFKGLQVAAGEKIVPFLTDLSIAITKVVDAANGGEDDGGFWSGLAAHAKTTVFGGIITSIGDLIHKIAGEDGKLATETAKANDEVIKQATALDELKKAIFSATDAQRSFEVAGRSLADAHRTLDKATADYNKLLKEGAVDEEKVADARRSLADATRSLGHAHREQTKAQEEYNDAAAAASILGTDTANDKKRDAADDLADANDAVTSALEAQAAAAADLAKAKAGDPDYQEKLADAKESVADATQGIADAEYNLGKQSYLNVAAHDAETKAIGEKAGEVARLRGELEELLKLNPEQFAFLIPILQRTFEEGGSGGGDLGPSTAGAAPRLSIPADAWNATGSPVAGPTTTTNNVTINATTSEADARLIAKEVIWNLN